MGEVTRLRVHIQQDRNRVINGVARLLQTVNLKLASVASNIVGKSGLAMLRLVQSAWGATRTKRLFLAALFFRIAQRRGMKKADVAEAHRILLIAWHILAEATEYQERSGDHFDGTILRAPRTLSRRLQNSVIRLILVAPNRSEALPKPIVDAAICPTCARWGLPRCIHLVKRNRK